MGREGDFDAVADLGGKGIVYAVGGSLGAKKPCNRQGAAAMNRVAVAAGRMRLKLYPRTVSLNGHHAGIDNKGGGGHG